MSGWINYSLTNTQIYILAKYLEYYTPIHVWIEGYAILLNGNSPVENQHILSSLEDIDRAIHTQKRNHPSHQDIDKIASLLTD